MPVTYQEETSLPWSNWSLANQSMTNAKGRDPDIVGAVFSNYQHAKPPERAKIRGSGEAWSKWEILGAKVFLAIMMAHSQGIWFNLRLTSKWPRSLPCCVLSVPSQLDHDEGSTVRIDEEVRNANEPLSSLRCFPPLISLGLYREISGVSP